MNIKPKIVLVDGPDCVGKTTIITKVMNLLIEQKTNCSYIHNGLYPSMKDAFAHYNNQIALASDFEGITLIDRGFVSEMVYGKVMRNTDCKALLPDHLAALELFQVNIIYAHLSLDDSIDAYKASKREEYIKDNLPKFVDVFHNFDDTFGELQKYPGLKIYTWSHKKNDTSDFMCKMQE